ncbi:MAG: nucleoside hydrolase [Alphaproteobacteria bacterium]|nr:MAG: nucleoside hydrolase [Alphaproteobacteria bacterium]
MINIIFDTDPGVDDAFALLYALNHPNINVLGITTVFGNVPVETSTKNALILSEMAHKGTIVYQGANKPLERNVTNYPSSIHGHDGLGDTNHPQSKFNASKLDAAQFIINEINENSGNINLVAVGPLTNIANSIKQDPSIANKVNSLLIMGGSWLAGGNITPVAEANIYNDPEAAEIVFKSGLPIIMVGLDVTHKVFLSQKDIDKLSSLNNSGKFLKKISNIYMKFYKDTRNMDGCFFHDATAVIAMTNPEFFKYKNARVYVSQDNLTRGQTVVYLKDLKHETAINDDRGFVQVLYDVESKNVISEYLKVAENYMH